MHLQLATIHNTMYSLPVIRKPRRVFLLNCILFFSAFVKPSRSITDFSQSSKYFRKSFCIHYMDARYSVKCVHLCIICQMCIPQDGCHFQICKAIGKSFLPDNHGCSCGHWDNQNICPSSSQSGLFLSLHPLLSSIEPCQLIHWAPFDSMCIYKCLWTL